MRCPHISGLLPRKEGAKRLPQPEYKPNNAWTRKKAMFGQNDYIGECQSRG